MKKIFTLAAVMGTASLVLMGAESPSSRMSPLLGDTSSFKQDKEDKTMVVFRHKELKVTNYEKFIIDPVLIYPSLHRGGEKLSPENLQKLSEVFRSDLLDALKGGYEIADVAGPRTLRLRFGIRDMKPGRYYMEHSQTYEINTDTSLKEVTFDMEGIDSLTGERVIAIVRTVSGEEVKGTSREEQRQRVSDVFSDWVKVLRNRLDRSNIPK